MPILALLTIAGVTYLARQARREYADRHLLN